MSNHARLTVFIRVGLIAVALVLAGALSACDSNPTRPTATPSTPVTPVSPNRLEIQGPRSVPPGGTAQFTAIAFMPDGSSRDVSTSTTWEPRQGSILTVQGGLVRGVAVGQVTILAAYNNLRSTKEVIVVPAGTYRLAGSVSEADAPSVPVIEARVEVTGGQGGGLVTTTGVDGRFSLYGVAGDVALRVSKDGYQTVTQTVDVNDHIQTGALGLALVRPRLDVSGTYTLTLTADAGCVSGLPDELRTRRYSALVTQTGPQVDVRLTGPTFAVSRAGRGDHFTGRVEPNQIVFDLQQYDAYYYGSYGDLFYADIFEQLSTTNYLEIWGRVSAVGTSGGFSGLLDGAFQQYGIDPRLKNYQNPTARCRSGAHRFQLSR